MKLTPSPLNSGASTEVQRQLSEISTQVNSLSEGRLVAKYNATTAAPTSGLHARGDRVPNSQPDELGSGGSMYVITEWICILGGEPGTWVESRTLTGN